MSGHVLSLAAVALPAKDFAMDKFVNASEYERQQAKEHARVIAFGVAAAFFALTGIFVMAGSDAYSWPVFIKSVLVALASWGLTYTVAYVIALPTEPGDWPETPEREVMDTPPADNQTKHQATAVWDGRVKIGNRLVPIPDDVGEENIRHIAAMRAKGGLSTVNPHALNGIGISRYATKPPNAQTVMMFLANSGLIDGGGEWTEQGRYDFPSPNDSPPPSKNVGTHSTTPHTHTATHTATRPFGGVSS